MHACTFLAQPPPALVLLPQGKRLAVHSQRDKYAANQFTGWDRAIGVQVPIFNKAHFIRTRDEAIKALAELGTPETDVDVSSYNASQDPKVFAIKFLASDGGKINGESSDALVLDTADKRSLRLYRGLLWDLGFTVKEVTWPEALGGETASYFVKINGTFEEAQAFCNEFSIPISKVN